MSEHISNGPDCYADDCCNRCWEKWMTDAVKAERERVLAEFAALRKSDVQVAFGVLAPYVDARILDALIAKLRNT